MEVEFGSGDRSGSAFRGLASASGFTTRQCEVAAVSGRLVDVVRIAQLRRRRTRAESPTYRGRRTLSGAQALARLQLMRTTWDDEG
jgi:hypothetical protein